MSRTIFRTLTLLALCALISPVSRVSAQGVTTSGLTGVVKDSQGAVVPGANVKAVHEPSGTIYEAVSQTDGRYFIPGMRVGGPYTVTADLSGFRTEKQSNIVLALGVVQDLSFTLQLANVTETVTVVAETSPVFASTRTGAATSVTQEDLASLPTVSGRITDITRLSPQAAGGNGTFVGQDNRNNNITIDGSYFNGSFGLDTTTGGPGDRTGVAPISLEVIEQVQVNVAPYDVRQGNFVGANVNSVTKSGTNRFTGSVYGRYRNQSFVGTEAGTQPFNPGTFKTTVAGEYVGGPIIRDKLFFFQSFEKQTDSRPLNTFVANPGGAPVTGNTTRVLASEMTALSSFLKTNFNYDTGAWDNITSVTPGKPWILKGNYNINSSNKVNFRYNALTSSTLKNQSGSSSLGTSRSTLSTQFLGFENTNYTMVENIKSGIGEWNSVMGNLTNNLITGYSIFDEPRAQIGLFPFVVIGDGAGAPKTAFGSEPFTPYNLLTYKTFQLQDSVTKFAKNHTLTFGGAVEHFHSLNSFYFGVQSAYSYNTLDDFYTDANGYLANPNRTVSPVALSIFQVKYFLQPGVTTPPWQELKVLYSSGYFQDEWRPRGNMTVTGGLRVDVPKFGATAYDNPAADALTFRDSDGSPVKYNTGALPATTPYWSPRVGANWDVLSDGTTQVRGGTGLFTGKPPYVWISNQLGNTGVLTGFLDSRNTTAYPFNPNPDKYKPVSNGGPAASYELDLTDAGFRFPQTWRTNAGVDRRLPGGLTATVDYIYNSDLNAPYYINANLPGANTAYTGVDPRPRWAVNATTPACVTTLGLENGPCVTKVNNARGNQVTANYVIKNQSLNNSWDIAFQVVKAMTHGFSARGGFNYGVSQSLVEPSSTASSSWGSANPVPADPNNPPLANSVNSPGKRVFVQASYTRQYFNLGATTVSMFYDVKPPINNFSPNFSWVFAGDANGDTVSNNDLIYIPRNTSEMNFKPLTVAGNTYSPADQAAAFEQLIQQDSYLKSHRGQYAQRGAEFFPMVGRMDLSITQDVFHSISGAKHSGQIRLDITNFGNLLNKNWGVSQRVIATNGQILTSPTADANGALTYNLQNLNGKLITSTFQTNAGTSDVYVMMLSFRYGFN
jgi:carboxypeptidase family protein